MISPDELDLFTGTLGTMSCSGVAREIFQGVTEHIWFVALKDSTARIVADL